MNLRAGIALFCCDKNISTLIYLQESNLNTSDWLWDPANSPCHKFCNGFIRKMPHLVTTKDNEHPRTGHEGPEREQRYSSTLSLTSALEAGGWSTPHLGRFTTGKENRYPFHRRLGGPKGRYGQARKISPPKGFDPRIVQPQRVVTPTTLSRPTFGHSTGTNVALDLTIAVWRETLNMTFDNPTPHMAHMNEQKIA